jgi:hypothetical protein
MLRVGVVLLVWFLSGERGCLGFGNITFFMFALRGSRTRGLFNGAPGDLDLLQTCVAWNMCPDELEILS